MITLLVTTLTLFANSETFSGEPSHMSSPVFTMPPWHPSLDWPVRATSNSIVHSYSYNILFYFIYLFYFLVMVYMPVYPLTFTNLIVILYQRPESLMFSSYRDCDHYTLLSDFPRQHCKFFLYRLQRPLVSTGGYTWNSYPLSHDCTNHSPFARREPIEALNSMQDRARSNFLGSIAYLAQECQASPESSRILE